MSKVKFTAIPLNLQMFAEEGGDTGVESASAAGEQQSEQTETALDNGTETGVEQSTAAESKEPYEKAFAKRLAAEREKWQQEVADQYKDYDAYRKVGDFIMRSNNVDSIMSVAERVELEELQQQAEKQNVPVEVLQRIQHLEAKAEEADQLKKEKELQDFYRNFRSELESFAKDKGADADVLEQFMIDNNIGSHEIAYKAMKTEELEAKLETAKKDAIKEYLESKKAPKTEGTGAAGVISEGPPKTWGEARQRALERFRSAKQQI